MATILLLLSILSAVIGILFDTYKIGSLPDSISAIVYDMPRRWQWACGAILCR